MSEATNQPQPQALPFSELNPEQTLPAQKVDQNNPGSEEKPSQSAPSGSDAAITAVNQAGQVITDLLFDKEKPDPKKTESVGDSAGAGPSMSQEPTGGIADVSEAGQEQAMALGGAEGVGPSSGKSADPAAAQAQRNESEKGLFQSEGLHAQIVPSLKPSAGSSDKIDDEDKEKAMQAARMAVGGM